MPETHENLPLLYRVEDAAAALAIGRSTAWNLIKAGRLEVRRIGARTLVTRESLLRVAENGASTAA